MSPAPRSITINSCFREKSNPGRRAFASLCPCGIAGTMLEMKSHPVLLALLRFHHGDALRLLQQHAGWHAVAVGCRWIRLGDGWVCHWFHPPLAPNRHLGLDQSEQSPGPFERVGGCRRQRMACCDWPKSSGARHCQVRLSPGHPVVPIAVAEDKRRGITHPSKLLPSSSSFSLSQSVSLCPV